MICAEVLLAEQTMQAARARDDAQRSEAHHRAVVENAAEGILTVGVDGTIRSFNAAAEAMFGWTATEILGQPVAMLVPPVIESAHDVQAVIEQMKVLRRGNKRGKITLRELIEDGRRY